MARGEPLVRQWNLLKTLQAHHLGVSVEELAERRTAGESPAPSVTDRPHRGPAEPSGTRKNPMKAARKTLGKLLGVALVSFVALAASGAGRSKSNPS